MKKTKFFAILLAFVLVASFCFAGCGKKEEGAATYTITFNSNGGSTVPEQIVDNGQTAIAPIAPTYAGYIFEGWFSGSKQFNFDTDKVTKNLTLTAKWRAIQVFTVTFNTEGGGSIPQQNVNEGTKATAPADPTKVGFVFDGWYVNDTKFNFDANVTANTTLTAKWTVAQQVDVTFVTNGGSDVPTQQVYQGSKATKPADPTKAGEVFLKWYSDEDCTMPYDFNTVITANKTLYGLFTIYDVNEAGQLVGFLPGATVPSHFIIPETVGEYAITEIAENTVTHFANYAATITELTIPSSITQIGIAAFANMTNLKKINFPDEGDLYLSAFAFQYAPIEGTLTIGGAVTTMQANVFQAKAASAGLLKTVIFTGATPPQIYKWEGDTDAQYWSFVSGIFSGHTGIEHVYVPEGLVDLYKSNEYLGKYYNDDSITNFNGGLVPQKDRDAWVGLIQENPGE